MIQNVVLPESKLRVLIADDNPETRRSVRLMLAIIPEVVVVAIGRDGQEAVDLARDYHPDLVILDINMPRKNGLVAYHEISQIYPDTGCIIISTDIPGRFPNKIIIPGIQEFLLKPFTVEEMQDVIERIKLVVWNYRHELLPAEQPIPQAEVDLKQLAQEYARARRVDDEAVGVFEKLAQDPACELRWLRLLAIMYMLRQDWAGLKALAARLELQAASGNK
jgi:YesN/AraC family two-component response regulator